jgi:hypothetical protein
MHSVVVLGDVRTHIYDKREKLIYGGAMMMRDKIEELVGSIDSTDSTGVIVYGYEPVDPEKSQAIIGFERVFWEIPEEKKKLRDSLFDRADESKRDRLIKQKEPKNPAKSIYRDPKPSSSLIRALAKYAHPRARPKLNLESELPPGTFFTLKPEVWHSNLLESRHVWCPEIVALNDLNGELKKLRFRIATEPLSQPATLPKIFASIDPVRIIFERLRTSTHNKSGVGKRVPSLEPVVLFTLQDYIPVLPDDLEQREERTAWEWLATNYTLRRRAIVVLDVCDLKTSAHLNISEELSWESTAQDIVYALRKSEKYRYLLEFSQLIIRIGHSGSLHVHRHDDREHTFHLYYDPLRDDGHWGRKEDGVVLGMSSLFAACIVEELIRNCNNHSERPVLQDLTTVIGAALPKAIRKCQLEFNKGIDAIDQPALRAEDELSTISSIAIPTQRSPQWSIVNDVTQTQLGSVARAIVREGIIPTLIQRTPSYDDIIRILANMVAEVVNQSLTPQFSFDSQFLDLTQSISTLLGQFDKTLDSSEREESLANSFVVFFGGATSFLDLNEQTKKDILDDTRSAVQIVIRNDPNASSFDLIRPFLRMSLSKILGVPADVQRSVIDRLLNRTRILDIAKAIWQNNRDVYRSIVQWPPFAELTKAIKETQFQDLSLLMNDYQIIRKHYSFDLYQAFLDRIGRDLLEPHSHSIVRAPLFTIDDRVVLVDRHEIEGVRTIKKLLQQQLKHVGANLANKKKLRPLSFAVFGPPGSGKSTAVKAVLGSISDGKKNEPLEFNMSRYSSPDELDDTFDQISEACNTNESVIVFIDEFDARFQDERWGLLKYFLSPMEDGVYGNKSVRNAIFVFAGGTSTTYEDFNLPESHPDFQLFRQAKGPDFTSRLKGHLNIVGVNQTDPNDQLYLIRRAAIIRKLLEWISSELPKDEQPDSKEKGKFQIDDDLLRALLFVPSYRNGARSIRNILTNLSMKKNVIRNSSLTTVAQLNMFTDGQAFFDLLNDVSAEKR